VNAAATHTPAKDLKREFPRGPREMLAGYVIAARMLDKCRAAIADTPGETTAVKLSRPNMNS
jgi:transposase